jgi:predicted PurR-regulated permease PerM
MPTTSDTDRPVATAAPSVAVDHWRRMLRRPATAVWSLALLALLAALWAGRTFVVAVVTSVALAVLLWPALMRAERLLRFRALAALAVLGVATALAAAVGGLVASQLSATTRQLPDALRLAARDLGRIDATGAVTLQRTRSALAELDRSVARVTGTARAPRGAPDGAAGSIVSGLVERSTGWIASLLNLGLALLLQAGVVVTLTFFLLCTGDRLAHRLSRWCDGRPLARGRFSPLVSDSAREVRRYGAVTLVTNALIGGLVAAGFACVGVPGAWLWGLVAAALHFVPYAGLALTMALAAVEVYVLHASWAAAALAAGYVALLGILVGSVLATWLQGRTSRIDSALMFGGTVFFAVLWGGWGLVLGPLMVVVLRVVVRHLQQPQRLCAPAPASPRVPMAQRELATS